MSGSPPMSRLKICRKSAKSQTSSGLRKPRLPPPDLRLLPIVLDCCYVDGTGWKDSFIEPKRKSWCPTIVLRFRIKKTAMLVIYIIPKYVFRPGAMLDI